MLKKIAAFRKRFFQEKPVEVDEKYIHEFLEYMPAKRASVLKDRIRILAEKNKGLSDEFIVKLTGLAKDHGWDNDELKKIRVFSDYFSDRIAPAYEAVMKNRLHESDFDMFVVACLSLYLNDEFDVAYKLLKIRDPDSPEFASDINFMSFAGYIVFSSGKDMRSAVRYYDLAHKYGVDTVAYATNSYVVYFEAGELEAAHRVRELIQRRYVNDPQAAHALAYVELAKGYYPEGFRLAEFRYDHPDAFRHLDISLLAKPRWKGEVLEGCRILVHGEQGLGDTIMCARYLPLMQKKGAKVIFECQEEAIALLEHNLPEVDFLSIGQNKGSEVGFDYWVGTMSLPHFFDSTIETIPSTNGYAKAPAEHLDYWSGRIKQLVTTSTPRIGLAWSGNPRHRSDRRRSIPFEMISPYVASFHGATWISLQTTIPEGCPDALINCVDEMPTLADTAALIEQMDLVITVDTSIVHLAGALGKATWLLLPYRYEWRWGLEGESNPWYDSVKVIRQAIHGDWKSVLDEVFNVHLPAYLGSQENLP